MIRNPHTLEDNWWDGPERFQYVNRNVISQIQNEDLFRFVKIFAPIGKKGLHIGGHRNQGKRANHPLEKEPLAVLVNLPGNDCDLEVDSYKLPYEDNSIGYIVSFHVLEHIKGKVRDIIREWVRVLVPGGLIGLSMPDKRYFQHDPKQTVEGKAAYHEMSSDDLWGICTYLRNVEILTFDKRKNNFDMDLVLRKL